MKLIFQKILAALGAAVVVALMLSFLLSGCTPVRYVYVDPKDSVIRKQRINYDDVHIPLYFNYNWYSRPYYYQPQRIIVTVPRKQSLPPRPPRGKH